MNDLVLVADGDQVERRYLAAILAADGFHILQTENAVHGMVWIARFEPVLIILAEDTEPLELGEEIVVMRRMTAAPLMIIGNDESPDEIQSLTHGGDFYLRRPFTAAEVILRARSLLRRTEPADDSGGGAGRRKPGRDWMISIIRETVADDLNTGLQNRLRDTA